MSRNEDDTEPVYGRVLKSTHRIADNGVAFRSSWKGMTGGLKATDAIRHYLMAASRGVLSFQCGPAYVLRIISLISQSSCIW